jgi:hypothetical protein
MDREDFIFLGTFENQVNVGIGRDAIFFKESAHDFFGTLKILPPIEVDSKIRRLANLLSLMIKQFALLIVKVGKPKPNMKIVYHPQIPTTRTPRFPIANTIQVVRIHDIFPITNPEWFPRGVKFHFKVQLKLLNTAGAVFICNSEYTRTELQSLIKVRNKCYVVGCPIDKPNVLLSCGICEVCSDSRILETKFAFSLGTIEPRKNFDFISREWPEVWRQTKANLVIAGNSGWKMPKIFNTDTSVFYVGKVCDSALYKLYSTASIYIAPSKAEGFDIPFHEAQKFNLTILASNIPVHQDFNVTLFSIKDSVEFRTKAVDLLRNDKRKTHYTFPNYSVDLINIWKSLRLELRGESN